jgi:hypothetical protein
LDDNAGEDQWFKLELLEGGSVKGQVQVVPGEFGGVAGPALQTSISMPITNRSTTKPTVAARARRGAAAADKAS